jgi:hypothetical protein
MLRARKLQARKVHEAARAHSPLEHVVLPATVWVVAATSTAMCVGAVAATRWSVRPRVTPCITSHLRKLLWLLHRLAVAVTVRSAIRCAVVPVGHDTKQTRNHSRKKRPRMNRRHYRWDHVCAHAIRDHTVNRKCARSEENECVLQLLAACQCHVDGSDRFVHRAYHCRSRFDEATQFRVESKVCVWSLELV